MKNTKLILVLWLLMPVLTFLSCSDDENSTYDLSDAVECTVSGTLKYDEAEQNWIITVMAEGSIDGMQIYYIWDYPIEQAKHEQFQVEAKGLRFPHKSETVEPAGVSKYNLKVESLNIIES